MALALLLAGGAALLNGVSIMAQPVPASAPASASVAPAVAASAPRVNGASRPAAPAASSAPASAPAQATQQLQLVYKTVVLPAGRVGSEYGPRVIVKGGLPRYAYTVEGKFPPGLELADDGTLSGIPTTAGRYAFTLAVRDASTPSMLTQQAYVLNVASTRSAAAASAPPPPLTAIPRDEAAAVADPFPGRPISYKLTPAGLAKLAPAAPAEATAPVEVTEASDDKSAPPPAAPAHEPLPNADQLNVMLQPVLDIEYPTRALFVQALQAARCVYYQVHIAEAAAKKGVAVDTKCPPDPPPAAPVARRPPSRAASAAAPPGPGTDALSLHQFHAELLPPDLLDAIVAEAAMLHPLAGAIEVGWIGDDCGCTPQRPLDQVYGFQPFWLATPERQPVDFSLFTRINYMGIVLNDAGGFDLPPHWDGHARYFVREAHRYGTKVDLVLYRRDWTRLLALPDDRLAAFARQAAVNGAAMIDTRFDDALATLRPRLLPLWNEPVRPYDGVTLFFEDSPADPAGRKRFATFFRGFMLQLIAEMQRSGRALRLNIVVPDHLLGEEGAYAFDQVIDYIERAEPQRTSKGVEGAAKVRYKGTTDITVEYLVLLAEPTSERKKALRARIDNTEVLQGHRRIAFIESVVPVLFHPRGEKPAPLRPEDDEQLDRDLAYMKWNYGGVAFWPVPVATQGSGRSVLTRLGHNYGAPPRQLDALCRIVCPNRTPLRALFELLVLVGAVSIGLYAWNCRVRRLGRPYLLFLWAGGLVTLLVGFALLSCDPDLARLRQGNALLYLLIAALFAAGVYLTFKPRVDPP